jgi:hypothetical protein
LTAAAAAPTGLLLDIGWEAEFSDHRVRALARSLTIKTHNLGFDVSGIGAAWRAASIAPIPALSGAMAVCGAAQAPTTLFTGELDCVGPQAPPFGSACSNQWRIR